MRISDWSSDVCSSDLFADARRGIVVRAVTRAEIAAEIAARLALGRAERDAAQVGADAERDQPVFLAGLGPPIDRLRIAQIAEWHLLRRLDPNPTEAAEAQGTESRSGVRAVGGLER